VWVVSPDLVLALDERLGAPVDAYVNGAHTWFGPDGPGGTALEWRLHPVAAYRAPRGLTHEDVWETVVAQLSTGTDAAALHLGDEVRPLTSLWDGLECFPVDTGDVEPATLSAAAAERIGRAPDRSGLVDHDRVGDAWERARGNVSIVALLLEQLST
jgi:hypothetical protein